MPPQTITRIRDLVRSLNYVVSIHAAENLKMTTSRSSTSKTSFSQARLSSDKETLKPAKSRTSFAEARSATAKLKRSSKSAPRVRSSSSRSTSSSRLCASCGRAGPQLRRVTRTFGKGRDLLVIESIPMWSCPHCGESYFTAQTMHEIERIKALRKSVAIERPVLVAEYQDEAA